MDVGIFDEGQIQGNEFGDTLPVTIIYRAWDVIIISCNLDGYHRKVTIV